MRRLVLSGFLALASAAAQPLSGLWDAKVSYNGLEIPFRMEFSGAGSDVSGSFFNGDAKVTSNSGRLDGELSWN